MAQPGLQGLLFGLLEWRGNLGHMVGKSVLYCTDYANQGSEGIQHRHPYYPNVGQFRAASAAAAIASAAAAAINRCPELSPTFG